MHHASNHKASFRVFLLYCIVFFGGLLIILEGGARLPVFQKFSPYRSVDNSDYQFEIKWFRLQDYVKENGGVDILFVGSSLVNTGIDPSVVEKTYTSLTGTASRMFNFGVEGMTISPTSALAQIIVSHYQPALIVVVTEMRDYIAGNGLAYETNLMADPWFSYQRGQPNFFGWLVDESAALQHYLPYRDWMRADFPDILSNNNNRYHTTTSNGYEPDFMIGTNVDLPPDPTNPEDAKYLIYNGNYQIDASRLEDLQNILTFSHSQGTKVLVLEMPVYPTAYAYFGGLTVHQQFQKTISSLVNIHGGTFLPAESCLNSIPLFGRSNRWHLNYIGAPMFSQCLGQQLAVYAKQQNTTLIKTGRSK
jgi:hypothetical protein